jgi:predicted MPP superfamily phosphohydrolase
MPSRKRLIGFVIVIQTILFLAHFFLYQTWAFSPGPGESYGSPGMKIALGLVSVSFIGASLLAFRYSNVAVRVLYKAAAVWLGLLTFLVAGASLAWIIFGITGVAGVDIHFHKSVQVLFILGLAAGFCGVCNAGWTRITRATVRLSNLPSAWRGRRAALISDLHLGHVRNGSFLRRIVAKVLREAPDAIFIAGDLFDGTAIDAHRATEPLKQLAAPQGVYFVAGNHEQFRGDSTYMSAVEAAGIRVLSNEKVDVDGLQILGVPYGYAVQRGRFASVLHAIGLDRERASILLTHAPDHPEIAEGAGISLQLSGHTHLGQFLPWNWVARRVYRQFVYGLSRIGNMQVFTSSGAGTWGPPLRLGSKPEIVVLEFQQG